QTFDLTADGRLQPTGPLREENELDARGAGVQDEDGVAHPALFTWMPIRSLSSSPGRKEGVVPPLRPDRRSSVMPVRTPLSRRPLGARRRPAQPPRTMRDGSSPSRRGSSV